MMHWRHGAIGVAGAALLIFTASLASAQDDAGKPKQTEKKKAKHVDVQVKVSTTDAKPVPAGLMVEISGQETDCGDLSQDDAKETVDDTGAALFRDLPACKVTVKINATRYVPVRKQVDLAGYKSCAAVKGNGDTGAAPPGCEPISLVLDPLT